MRVAITLNPPCLLAGQGDAYFVQTACIIGELDSSSYDALRVHVTDYDDEGECVRAAEPFYLRIATGAVVAVQEL